MCQSLCLSVDREDNAKLAEFSQQCFDELAAFMGTLLQLELGGYLTKRVRTVNVQFK